MSSKAVVAKVLEPEGPAVQAPTEQEIAARAHEIYVQRGGIHGDDLADWLQAERELSAPKSNS